MAVRHKNTHPFTAFSARRTRRLVLRPYVSADFEAWTAAWTAARPAQNRWDSGPRSPITLTRAAFRDVLVRQRRARVDGQILLLGAFERRTGLLIGTGAFENLTLGSYQSVHIGFEVLNNFWGLGFGKEIAGGLVRAAFDDFVLHRVEALVNPANRRSLRLCRSIGMRREGLSRARIRTLRGWSDMVVMALTADE